ncbi:MAG: hypothetical protein Harvfovirus22_8 [Harvfovirus sp.]|uniref:Uncharacterized protein n=1 Tax=Harvfovirus sp. TaxID=2487768 RepID=A0A3G5A5Y3_9VIRU|nr:MAG: hypothetical protein Harvfovirus22_8 [Harvfovirus sp.]
MASLPGDSAPLSSSSIDDAKRAPAAPETSEPVTASRFRGLSGSSRRRRSRFSAAAAAAAASTVSEVPKRKKPHESDPELKTKIARTDNPLHHPGENLTTEKKIPDNIEECITLHKKRINDLKLAKLNLYWSVNYYNKVLSANKFLAHHVSPVVFEEADAKEIYQLEGEPDQIDEAIKFNEMRLIETENILIKIKLLQMMGLMTDIVNLSSYNRFCKDLETVVNSPKGWVMNEIKENCKRMFDIKQYIHAILREKRFVLQCFKEVKIPANMEDMTIVEQFIEDLHKLHNSKLIDSWCKSWKNRSAKEMESFVKYALPCAQGCLACQWLSPDFIVDVSGIDFRNIGYFNVMSDKFVGCAKIMGYS